MENKEFVKNYIRVENTKNIPWNWAFVGYLAIIQVADVVIANCETELLIRKR